VAKNPGGVKDAEITDPKLFSARRLLLRGAVLGGSLVATGLLYRKVLAPRPKSIPGTPLVPAIQRGGRWAAPEAGDGLTSLEDITNYNNFYEVSTSKYLAEEAQRLRPRPWSVQIGGLVHAPRTFDIEEILRLAPLEERVYRLRCVEGWSMVIPWVGFPLSKLLGTVQPLGSAKHVAFETLLDPEQLPNQKTDDLSWPYVEGLRLDEAMHPLTLLALGLYGRTLAPQNGAPLRLVVPWKYGFKGAKSIVRITLTELPPATTWNLYAPDEYGYYSNVNPEVAHPRWSQARERRIGELGKRDTLLFNGYGADVAHLYAGMDLKRDF
jgi:methionine sulfoxide reductase catalytic subunit